MDNLKVFENDEFGQLSVTVKNNKEYIEAIEVATILGYSKILEMQYLDIVMKRGSCFPT